MLSGDHKVWGESEKRTSTLVTHYEYFLIAMRFLNPDSYAEQISKKNGEESEHDSSMLNTVKLK